MNKSDPAAPEKLQGGKSVLRIDDGRVARGALRRRAILDVARALFMERGYRGTTLAEIIARAGGSRETIYKTLGGKRGIFHAIVASAGEQLAASILTPEALTLPPREGLMRMGLDLADIWHSEEGQAVQRLVMSEGLDAPELIDAWYYGGSALSVDALATYLAAQVAAKRLAALDPPLVGRQFVTLLMGEFAFPFIAGDDMRRPLEEHVARCVDLIVRAYAPGPGPAE